LTVSCVKSHDRSRTRRRTVCWCLAVLLFSGTVLAEEPPKLERRKIAPTFRFSKRLVPRVSAEMESLSARHVSAPGHQLPHHVLYEELAASVRRDVERQTRKAVKSYLMDVINLDRGIDSLKARVRGESGEPGDPTEKRSSVHYRLGFHSGLPVVGLSYNTGPGELSFKVGADGAVGLRYRISRMREADVSAAFDGEDRFEVRALLAF
jgi:hypothetical protein